MLKIFILISISIILVAFLQAIIWRLPYFCPSLRTVLALLVVSPCIVVVTQYATKHLPDLSLLEWAMALFYYIATSLCYLITFTGIESNSPTLSLLLHLKKHPGMSKEQLLEFFANQQVVEDRYNSMIKNGFLIRKENKIILSAKPFVVFRIILWYRNSILGITNFGG